MDWLQFIGSFCFGLLVGGLVAYCIISARELILKIIVGIVGVIVGGTILRFFAFAQDDNLPMNTWIWWYFVGLLVGAVMLWFIKGDISDVNDGPPDDPKPPISN